MNCTKCNVELQLYRKNGLEIPYCKSCGGVWLTYDKLNSLAALIDLKTNIINPITMEPIRVKEEAKHCPVCGKEMQKVYFNGTVVDKCMECKGIWFDEGELAKFFRLFMKKNPGMISNLDFIDIYTNPSRQQQNFQPMPELNLTSKEKERRVASINGYVMSLFLLILLLVILLLMYLFQYWLAIPLGIIFAIMLRGFKLLKPQEALVLTVFGNYIGTLKGAGFHYVNPFAQNTNLIPFEPISLKAMTLQNNKQKINDELGNPIEVSIVVIWEVEDTAKAIFNVNNYPEFLSVQSDSALRNIVRMYPYDTNDESGKQSLRGDSQEISSKLKAEIQRNVRVAGINVIDAKITHLAYAPEIAVAMLQRQQAAAVIDAKRAIVEGAVSMVEMALDRLNQNNVVKMDDAEKTKMVNNLLVILCGNKEAQPVITNN